MDRESPTEEVTSQTTASSYVIKPRILVLTWMWFAFYVVGYILFFDIPDAWNGRGSIFAGLVTWDAPWRYYLLAGWLLPFLLVGFVSAFGISWVMAAYCLKVVVSGEGLRGNSFWGLPHTLPWERMVRARRMLSLPIWIHVHVDDHRRRHEVCVLVHRRRWESFKAAVHSVAPKGNPLFSFLSTIETRESRSN